MDDMTRIGFMEHLNRMTVVNIKSYATSVKIQVPSGLRKNDVICYIVGVLAERQQGSVLLSNTTKIVNYSSVTPIKFKTGELGVNDHEWKSQLLAHGVAVVKVPNFDPELYKGAFWEWLYELNTGIKEDDVRTWSLKGLPHTIRGMFKSYIGQQLFIWDIREKCYEIFKSIWGTDQLLSSFDGATLSIPDPKKSTAWESWFHYDQGRFNTGLCSLQSAVYLTDVNPGDPGFTYVENSHNLFEEHLREYQSAGYVWQTFDVSENKVLGKQRIIMPIVKAGEMVIWDSRIAHSTIKGYTDKYRMVAYVCMMPCANASSAELKKRIELYQDNRMTGHWCYGPFFSPTEKDPYKRGEQYNKPATYYPPPLHALSPLRRMLIGGVEAERMQPMMVYNAPVNMNTTFNEQEMREKIKKRKAGENQYFFPGLTNFTPPSSNNTPDWSSYIPNPYTPLAAPLI